MTPDEPAGFSTDARSVDRFRAMALANPTNRIILERLPQLGVLDTWLVAGCLFQTVWNLLSDRPATAGIKDYDVFYCDGSDLSWHAEDRVIRRAAELFADIDATIEVRNQARVHLWYRQRFGEACPRLTSSRHAIGRYLVMCTCVGAHSDSGKIEVFAPYGLDDLFHGRLAPNPVNDSPRLFAAKAASYRARWPWLTVVDHPAAH